MNEYGIESIKETLSSVLSLTASIANALEDGKINFLTEGIPLISSLVVIPKLVQNAKKSFAELKDLDKKEAKEVALFFESSFDIKNDELEHKIEEAIFLLSESYDFITGAFPLVGKWRLWIQSLQPAK